MKKIHQLALSLLAVSFTANADIGVKNFDKIPSHMYLGLSVGFIDVDVDVNIDSDGDGIRDLSGSGSFDNTLMGLQIGYQFNTNFAVEFRGYTNVSDEEIAGSTIEVNDHFAIIGKAILPIDQYFKPYALIGYGKTKGEIDNFSETEDDFIFGAGVAINNGNPIEVAVEWVNLFDSDFGLPGVSFEGQSVNVNLIYHFPQN